jgi:hypothetical protein
MASVTSSEEFIKFSEPLTVAAALFSPAPYQPALPLRLHRPGAFPSGLLVLLIFANQLAQVSVGRKYVALALALFFPSSSHSWRPLEDAHTNLMIPVAKKTNLTNVSPFTFADYRETAAKFQKEWHVKEPHRDFSFAPHVKGHALVSVVNRGLIYYALEREYALSKVWLFSSFLSLSLPFPLPLAIPLRRLSGVGFYRDCSIVTPKCMAPSLVLRMSRLGVDLPTTQSPSH